MLKQFYKFLFSINMYFFSQLKKNYLIRQVNKKHISITVFDSDLIQINNPRSIYDKYFQFIRYILTNRKNILWPFARSLPKVHQFVRTYLATL